MKKVVFLCSGGGGTLKFLDHYLSKTNSSNLRIAGVIADRKCGALEYSEKTTIPSHVVPYSKENSKPLLDLLKELKPDFVVTNTHRILDSQLVKIFEGKLINLHYSLLPSFGGVIGMKTLDLALQQKSKIVGATCHHVTEAVDAGAIISQAAFTLDESEPRTKLENRMFRVGCLTMLNAFGKLDRKPKSHVVEVEGKPVLFSPYPSFDESIIDENFWKF